RTLRLVVPLLQEIRVRGDPERERRQAELLEPHGAVVRVRSHRDERTEGRPRHRGRIPRMNHLAGLVPRVCALAPAELDELTRACDRLLRLHFSRSLPSTP